ncbi:MAG: hypothetical protein IJ447_02110 [Clostridia bacterium]|nr:hypothetical protein [Clostridia bacterium]
MTLIQKLDEVLKPMGFEFFPNVYTGNGIEYGIYDNITEGGDLFCDDAPEFCVTSFRVHIYVLDDRIKKKKQLKSLLRSAGFLLGDITEQHEKETGYTHYTFEVETFDPEGGEI